MTTPQVSWSEAMRRILDMDVELFRLNPRQRYFLRPADPSEIEIGRANKIKTFDADSRRLYVLPHLNAAARLTRSVLVLPAGLFDGDPRDVVSKFLLAEIGDDQPGVRQ